MVLCQYINIIKTIIDILIIIFFVTKEDIFMDDNIIFIFKCEVP